MSTALQQKIQPKKLTKLVNMGLSDTQIAKKLGVSQQAVSKCRNKLGLAAVKGVGERGQDKTKRTVTVVSKKQEAIAQAIVDGILPATPPKPIQINIIKDGRRIASYQMRSGLTVSQNDVDTALLGLDAEYVNYTSNYQLVIDRVIKTDLGLSFPHPIGRFTPPELDKHYTEINLDSTDDDVNYDTTPTSNFTRKSKQGNRISLADRQALASL